METDFEIYTLPRYPDSYEKEYCGLEEVTQGYYSFGHINRESFLSDVLDFDPATVVDTIHYGWFGRYVKDGRKGDTHIKPWKPTAHDVYHVYWRRYGENDFRRSRAGVRGSFPITYLPIESDPIGYLHVLWEK